MAPRIAAASIRAAGARLELAGDWSLNSLGQDIGGIRRTLAQASASTEWDLGAIVRLDSFGAILIWRAWGERWPAKVSLQQQHRRIIERAATIPADALPRTAPFGPRAAVVALGDALLGFVDHALHFIALLGQLFLDCIHLLRNPRQFPLAEVSAGVYKVGVKAMPVAAMVGFLIGVVLSYLSSLQLKTFGADIFIINILGLGIIRELGPVLVSVLVAGRSGSAMTAQLGVMRVTEEIDALAAMGVSRSQRLVLPKVFALMLAMPLLVLWTSAVALLGGAVSAWVELGLAPSFFLETLPRVVPIANLYIGLLKGAVFGLLIALVACHFGLRVQPNTESLSASTTASVVSAITIVILADAAFAIATRTVGVVA
ncbi:ABC transporter permease [Azoarcus sp. TTM-91]|uniref:MlaE family ABC transporter permease n=1 Tax=Azoarcus sp. TTM-91 TaxID=2691581 RepID=UPI00145E28CC|nr:ABC transporter permease [Azoarcus sp. TTM-91]NMG34286.1 ABC transporter permease [Azoarcus sp. TTM-91]